MDKTGYIESYLEGSLKEEEKLQFEAQLVKDPEFAMEYDKHLAAYALIKSNGAFQTKEILRRHEFKKYGTNYTRILKVLLSAAAVVLVIITMFIFRQPKSTDSADNLFATYFIPYRDPVNVRSNAGPNDLREKANTFYRAKDFKTATTYYNQIPDPTPADKLYHGLSLLQASDTEMAIAKLAEVAGSESDYSQQATWYLSLAYIKAGNHFEAVKILHRIINNKDYMHLKSEELLKNLEG